MKKQFSLKSHINLIACIFLILIYAGSFCYFSFSDVLLFSENYIDDLIFQKGISPSEDIYIIEITKEDIDRNDIDPALLAAEMAYLINADEKNQPAAIDFTIRPGTMSKEAQNLLISAAKKGDNIVISQNLSYEEKLYFKNFENQEIIVSKTKGELIQGKDELFTLGHSIHISDKAGIMRHALFSVKNEEGEIFPSTASLCYQKYCEINKIQYKFPIQNKHQSAIIKFYEQNNANNIYNAEQIIRKNFNSSDFKDKIVLIGYTDDRLDQGYFTAKDYNNKIHGVEFEAQIINAFLKNAFAIELPFWMQIGILSFSILVLSAFLFRTSFFTGLCACILYELIARILSILLFGIGYLNSYLPHLINGILTGIVFSFVSYFLSSSKKEAELKKVLGKYIDSNVAENIIKEEKTLLPKTVSSKKIAVLFADIRGFTSISEKLSPKLLVKILNEVLSALSFCITKNGGTLDKFIGDCAMAYWGAPGFDNDPVYHACLAAVEMQRKCEEISYKNLQLYGLKIQIGIGINYGEAVVGNIGSLDRMNFTAVGDNVNIASRLESLAPAGQIYISESVKEQLAGRGEISKLEKNLILKGKEKPIPAYNLINLSVHNQKEKSASSKRSAHRTFSSFAAIINFAILFSQFITITNSIRSMGINYLLYFPLSLSAISAIVMALMISYDVKSIYRIDNANIRSHFADVLALSALSSNMQSAVSFLIHVVSKEGMGAYLNSNWPGGISLYLLCPIMNFLSFFVFESKAKFKIKDIFYAELPLLISLLSSAFIAKKLGLDAYNLEVFNLFYAPPQILFGIFAEILGISLIYLLNKKDYFRIHLRFAKKRDFRKKFTKSKLVLFFKKERNLTLLNIAINLIIAIFSIKVTITSHIMGGEIDVYSNPSLVGVIVTSCCILMMALDMEKLVFVQEQFSSVIYRYASSMRTLGCVINFLTMLLLAISGEGIKAFFTPKWYADSSVFLFCPFISVLTWLPEHYEYKLYICLLSAIPFASILPFSKSIIYKKNLAEAYSYELSNFYENSTILVTIMAIILMAVIMYLLNLNFSRLSRGLAQGENSIMLHVCGNRSSVKKNLSESDFGNLSNCYVIRDGNYGIVIEAGSGLKQAREILEGCSNVDILLASSDKSSVIGVSEVSDFCPKANIRVFYAAKFQKPENSLKARWIKLKSSRKIKLNNLYSVRFIPLDASHFMIKISGTASIFYTGKLTKSVDLKKWVSDTELLIYDGNSGWKEGCYLSIDSKIPNLIISGYSADIWDSYLEQMENQAKKILSEVFFARQGYRYPIHPEI